MTRIDSDKKSDWQQVGIELDAAEAFERETPYQCSDFDIIAPGVFGHDRARCPACHLADVRSKYFTLARQPWLATMREIDKLDSAPTDGERLPKLAQAVLDARENCARVFDDPASTAREQCDAGVLEERAEGIWKIVWRRWDDRMAAQRRSRQRKKRA